tara:strand:+ start:101171 stop:101548 length:378 start_codon:yes stop_codon:yes gene_type:complete
MNRRFLVTLRVLSVIVLVLIYVLFSALMYFGLENPSVIVVIRHVFLVSGAIPLCCWVLLLISRNFGKDLVFLLNVLLITFFHVFVFAVSAHKDGVAYWAVQSIEIAWFLYVINGKKGGWMPITLG